MPLPGRRFEYAYENAGNRLWSNHTGVSGARENYTHNALNQVVTKESNSQASTGATDPANAVSVDGTAAGRQGRFYSGEVLPPSSSAPFNYSFAVLITPPGQLPSSENRTILALSSLQAFTYDADGNLQSDGLWDYTWDAENRLVRMATTSAAVNNGVTNREITFRYDYLGRRVQKRVVNLTTSGEISSRRFLYDGWNLIAEFDAPNGTSIGVVVRSYTWGLDIVHSLTSAGGVGALLQIFDRASGKAYLPTYDANGNVASLVNAATGAIAASYEYSPFGEPLRSTATDPAAADQPFRFSTKFTDLETGLVYYGRRYYDPRLGRWVSRDPKEELGGINLYGFVGNNAINRWDYLGMCGDDGSENRDEYSNEEAANTISPTDLRVNVDGNRVGSASSAEATELEGSARANGVPVNTAGSSSTPNPTSNGYPASSVVITVETVIRDPDFEAGVKSTHVAVVNTSTGELEAQAWQTGYTVTPAPVGYVAVVPARGPFTSGFDATSTIRNGTVYTTMMGETGSWFVPANINYSFTIGYNPVTRNAIGQGTHDGYPSYTVDVYDTPVYDFQQKHLGSLLGSGDTQVQVGPVGPCG